MVPYTALTPEHSSASEPNLPPLELITTPAELAAEPITDPVTVPPVLKALVDASDVDVPAPPQPADHSVDEPTVQASTSASPSRHRVRRIHPRRPAAAAAADPVVHYVPATDELWRRFAGEADAYCSTAETPREVFLDPASVRPEATPDIEKVTCIDCVMSIAAANIVRHRSQLRDMGFDAQLTETPGYHPAPAVEPPSATTVSHAA